jgi:hypothetical protein
MNNTLGFLVTSIENNEQSKFILETINRLSLAGPFIDHVLFNSFYNHNITSFNHFATLHINEAKYFKGPMICFSLNDMIFLNECIAKQKIFWVAEIEWPSAINNQTNNYQSVKLKKYEELKKIYVDQNDILCSSSANLKNILDICWKSSLLIPDNTPEAIYEYIKL